MLITNEITGRPTPIARKVYLAWENAARARRIFEDFARHHHNTSSIESATVYMFLMKQMDEAKKEFLPFRNAWYIAKKGYSLN